MGIRILVADDHKIMRDGLKALLEKQEGMEVIAEAEDGRMTVALAREQSPDVVIMDIEMPRLNGIEATRRITSDAPNVKVIALSMHSDKRFVAQIFKAGASAYVIKDAAFEELTRAILAVVSGQSYLSPEIARPVMEDYVRHLLAEDSSRYSFLTSREREVLQLLAEGRTTKDISALLHVSMKTVDTHRKSVMDKLELRNTADLVKYAIREGLTSL